MTRAPYTFQRFSRVEYDWRPSAETYMYSEWRPTAASYTPYGNSEQPGARRTKRQNALRTATAKPLPATTTRAETSPPESDQYGSKAPATMRAISMSTAADLIARPQDAAPTRSITAVRRTTASGKDITAIRRRRVTPGPAASPAVEIDDLPVGRKAFALPPDTTKALSINIDISQQEDGNGSSDQERNMRPNSRKIAARQVADAAIAFKPAEQKGESPLAPRRSTKNDNNEVMVTSTNSLPTTTPDPVSYNNPPALMACADEVMVISTPTQQIRKMRSDLALIQAASAARARAPPRTAINAMPLATTAVCKSAQLRDFVDFLEEDFPMIQRRILSYVFTPDSGVRTITSLTKFPDRLHVSHRWRAFFARQYYSGATFVGKYDNMCRFLEAIPVQYRGLIKNIYAYCNANTDDGAQDRLDRFTTRRDQLGIIQHNRAWKDAPKLGEVWNAWEVSSGAWKNKEKFRCQAMQELKSRLPKWVAPEVKVVMEEAQMILWLIGIGLMPALSEEEEEKVRPKSARPHQPRMKQTPRWDPTRNTGDKPGVTHGSSGLFLRFHAMDAGCVIIRSNAREPSTAGRELSTAGRGPDQRDSPTAEREVEGIQALQMWT